MDDVGVPPCMETPNMFSDIYQLDPALRLRGIASSVSPEGGATKRRRRRRLERLNELRRRPSNVLIDLGKNGKNP